MMKLGLFLSALGVGAVLTVAACSEDFSDDLFNSVEDIPEPPPGTPGSGLLDPGRFTMTQLLSVDLASGIATVPLHRGTFEGNTVWFVLMDASDSTMASNLGLNFAPRLANAANGCLACLQRVRSSDPIPGRANVEFSGTIDFSPARILVPGPTGSPPLLAQPGAVAGPGYSDLIQVEGSSAVFNAPIIAVGDGPFDVTTHTNTNDRVVAIDTQAMTAGLLFIRAFSNGKEVFYFSFGSSGAFSAVLERGTFFPVLGSLAFANDSENPAGVRSAIVAFTNGQLGPNSPPAQGIRHVIVDGLQSEDANLQNTALLEALRLGGDSHNVLETFTTLQDDRLRRLYSPMWDLRLAEWSPEAVASGRNFAQTDVNVIRQLAAEGIVTNPGGSLLTSANQVVNCPILGFRDEAPSEPQADRPPGVP